MNKFFSRYFLQIKRVLKHAFIKSNKLQIKQSFGTPIKPYRRKACLSNLKLFVSEPTQISFPCSNQFLSKSAIFKIIEAGKWKFRAKHSRVTSHGIGLSTREMCKDCVELEAEQLYAAPSGLWLETHNIDGKHMALPN